MGSYGGEIFWGIVSAFVAFLLGLAWERLTQLAVNYRARRFWRPLIAEKMSVVLGRFRDLPGFEASGVIGAGDNIALKHLADYFIRIGFKRFTVLYNDQFGWNDVTEVSPLKGNLILIGGPDANRLTRDVLERVPLGIEFLEVSPEYLRSVRGEVARPVPLLPLLRRRTLGGALRAVTRQRPPKVVSLKPEWRIPVFLDKVDNKLHGPRMETDGLVRDCGVVIRCPNPFNPTREVMIFCGSYGFGTWAAVQYTQSKEFLDRVPKRTRYLECVLTVEVVRETPHNIRVELLRPLEVGAPVPEARIIVPRIVT